MHRKLCNFFIIFYGMQDTNSCCSLSIYFVDNYSHFKVVNESEDIDRCNYYNYIIGKSSSNENYINTYKKIYSHFKKHNRPMYRIMGDIVFTIGTCGHAIFLWLFDL